MGKPARKQFGSKAFREKYANSKKNRNTSFPFEAMSASDGLQMALNGLIRLASEGQRLEMVEASLRILGIRHTSDKVPAAKDEGGIHG